MTKNDSKQNQPHLYRPCVGTMLLNADNKVFVGKRIDSRETIGREGDWWQMPQGGVDDGEDLDTAMLRELEEETGLGPALVNIVTRMADELYYDLPPELQRKLWKGRYLGQRQIWYLARFSGSDADIDLNAHKHPEFCEFKWVEPAELPGLIVPFKKPIYEAVVAGFSGQF